MLPLHTPPSLLFSLLFSELIVLLVGNMLRGWLVNLKEGLSLGERGRNRSFDGEKVRERAVPNGMDRSHVPQLRPSGTKEINNFLKKMKPFPMPMGLHVFLSNTEYAVSKDR